MQVTLFNLHEDFNTVFQCPIQIVECESLVIMGMLNQARLEALYVELSQIEVRAAWLVHVYW